MPPRSLARTSSRDSRCLRLRRLGKLEGQIVLAQRDFDFHARVGIGTQELDHLADRLTVLGRLLDQLDCHHLPRYRQFGAAVARQHDFLIYTAILGDNVVNAMLDKDATDHARIRTLQHLDNLCLAAPFQSEPVTRTSARSP